MAVVEWNREMMGDEGTMSERQPVELKFIHHLKDGKEEVQTGIYVFDNLTIKDLYKFCKECEILPDAVEIDMHQFEEEE